MTQCNHHQICIETARANAQAICSKQGAKLTALREQVLLLIWSNHKPLGAYALMDMLAQATNKRVAPPTVYRALEFLLNLGLIHRIHSLNAYIGCTNPESHQYTQDTEGGYSRPKANHFFICSHCHDTQETIDTELTKKIASTGNRLEFSAQQQWLEVIGLCKQCQQL